MDNSSRRAFALDSRTVWVEQQLRHSVIIPKDNLPIGPGEYYPQIVDRHISTPALGKFRGPADSFKSFSSSDLKLKTPLNQSSLAESSVTMMSPPPRTGGSEFSTIFHDHDIRQPIDPNTRFCETPGCYLGQDPILRTMNHDGIKKVGAIHFGPDDIPFGDRVQYKLALPSYSVNYDSKHIKPVTKLGSFDKGKRELKQGVPCYYDQASPTKKDESEPPMSPHRKAKMLKEANGQKSQFEIRCGLVPLPKLKVRHPEVLTFNTSSYMVPKTEGPLSLTPKRINREASVNLFEKILIIPRKHVSSGYTKPSTASQDL